MNRLSNWGWALLALTALRLLVAALLPLAPDEAYYWVWSRALATGYLDHPPMVALWIRAGTLIAGENALGIRLLAPIGVALASWALADAAERIFPGRRVGVWSAALFNATLMIAAGSILITPDTPQIVFWCFTLWALARISLGGPGWWWLIAGAFAGCALASKYTAVFLGLGILLWVLSDAGLRRHLLRGWIWAGGALAVAIFTPVILWNAEHGWASFAKQGGRAGDGHGFTFRYLGELIGAQFALATPIIFVLGVLGVAAAVKLALKRDRGAALLVAMTVPATLIFLWQATGSRVQGNWPAILYPTLCIAAAGCLGARAARWRVPALAMSGLVLVPVLIQAIAAPLPLKRGSDPTLARLGGWPELAAAMEEARVKNGASFIASEEYSLAAELALHLPKGVPVVAIGDRWDLFRLSPPEPGQRGLLLQSERRSAAPYWPGAEPVGRVIRARKGIEAEAYRLFIVQTPAPGQDVAVLPRPR
ncbi:glycosyltransferase family 39 protein [Acetobacteraceae bacterium H6797]|nr:glycosyltransferase family 39 protein [Acetobacteraceae bacterium H6797]